MAIERDENGRIVKGTVLNPKGRPSKEREQKYYDITLHTITFTDWERIMQKARDQALKGDSVARKFLADYLIGPPIQKLEHTGKDGGPIEVMRPSDIAATVAALLATKAPEDEQGR